MSDTRSHKHYGNLYYSFLDKKSCKVTNQNLKKPNAYISITSQKVYSLIPYAYEYENSNGACKQLCLLSTELFLESPALVEYAKSFSHILMSLRNKNSAMLASVKSLENKKIAEKYSHSSKFIRGSDISKEVMAYSLSLKDHQKASVLLVIGGHTVNIVMQNHGNNIISCYYDPYEGQLYKQSATRVEIKEALEGHHQFIHPQSIWNENNILLGKLAAREDTLLDASVPFILMTFISNTENLGSKQEITFPDDVQPKEIISYLAHSPIIFDNILYSTGYIVLQAFLKQHGKEILAEMKTFSACTSRIAKCSDYVQGMLQAAQKGSSEIQRDIRNLYYNEQPKETSFTQPIKKAKICLKEQEVCTNQANAVRNFVKIIFDDKAKLFEGILNCTKQSKEKEKIAAVEMMCKQFSNVDPSAFDKAHTIYYNYLDNRYSYHYKEKCYDPQSFDEYLAFIPAPYDEL